MRVTTPLVVVVAAVDAVRTESGSVAWTGRGAMKHQANSKASATAPLVVMGTVLVTTRDMIHAPPGRVTGFPPPSGERSGVTGSTRYVYLDLAAAGHPGETQKKPFHEICRYL